MAKAPDGKRRIGQALLGAALAGLLIGADSANRIEVDVASLRNDAGQVLCDLFALPADFPAQPERRVAHVKAATANRCAELLRTAFEPLPATWSQISDRLWAPSGLVERISK